MIYFGKRALCFFLLLIMVLMQSFGQDSEMGTEPAPLETVSIEFYLTFDEVVQAALNRSAQLALLELQLSDLMIESGLKGFFNDTSLSVNAGVSGSPDNWLAGYSGSVQIGTVLEILPQLSVNGNVSAGYGSPSQPGSVPVSGSAGFLFKPFAATGPLKMENLEISRKKSEITALVQSLSNSAVLKYLDLISGYLDQSMKKEIYELSVKTLIASENLYAAEQILDVEYNTVKQAEVSAGHNLQRSELSYELLLESFSYSTGIPVNEIVIPEFSQFNVMDIISASEQLLEENDINQFLEKSSALQASEFDISAAEIAYSDANIINPQFSVTAGMDFPSMEYSAALSFSLSPAGIAVNEKKAAQIQLSSAQNAFTYNQRVAFLNIQASMNELKFAVENLEAVQFQLSADEKSFTQAEFFRDKGQQTEIQFLQARIDLLASKNDLALTEMNIIRKWFALQFGQFN